MFLLYFIVETANLFRCIDLIIDKANLNITENLIKQLHFILKNGTTDSRKNWFVVGDYKKLPNEVGGKVTTSPEKVEGEVKSLIEWYNNIKNKTLNDIIEFHYRFEYIHPFQDGNGRVGRLLMFKECLKYNVVPFIIDEKLKMLYYRGLKEWEQEKGYLIDTCLAAQDHLKFILIILELIMISNFLLFKLNLFIMSKRYQCKRYDNEAMGDNTAFVENNGKQYYIRSTSNANAYNIEYINGKMI